MIHSKEKPSTDNSIYYAGTVRTKPELDMPILKLVSLPPALQQGLPIYIPRQFYLVWRDKRHSCSCPGASYVVSQKKWRTRPPSRGNSPQNRTEMPYLRPHRRGATEANRQSSQSGPAKLARFL